MTVGKIIATEESPTPTRTHFVTDEDMINKDQYVKYDSPQGKVIGMVKDLHKTNRYFDSPESISQIEKTGVDIGKKFPIDEWEHTVGEVKSLGIQNSGMVKRPTQPPAPGTEVEEPTGEELKEFLGFEEHGLEVGKLQHHDTDIKLNLTDLFQKHLAVLAQTGAGKTYTVSVLMEELLEREAEEGRPASLVVDVHGEYESFAQSEKYRDRVKLVDGEDFKIPVQSLSISDFEVFLPGMRRPQKRELTTVIKRLRKREEPYGIDDIVNEIQADDEMHEDVQKALTAWLNNLNRNLFTQTGSNIDRLVEPGKLTVLDLSNMIKQKERRIITAYVAEKLFSKRRSEEIPPFILFLEEAHNFAKEGANAEKTMAKGIIETISREGRKFGASLCLVSQRPMKLSTTALSQCNTQLIMRITNPHDLDHIRRTSEGIDEKSLESLTTLKVGEALIVGEAVNHPIFVDIRERNSDEISLGDGLEQQAKDYEKDKEKREKDAEAFM